MANALYIITGGGGFLGSHLALRLKKQGADVIAIDNFCTGSRFNEKILKENGVRFIEADVCGDWNQFLNSIPMAGLKTIFHFASPASPPHYQRLGLETMRVNSFALEKALEWADRFGAKTLFSSTSEIYGDPLVSPQPESYWGNVNTVGIRSCYDESKRFGEALIHTWNLKNGTKHGFFRIFNTYGPRMNPADGRVVINFLVQALKGESLTIYGDGKQTRSFCFVDDLIDGFLAYDQSGQFRPINLGNEVEFTILELAKTVASLFPDKNLNIVHKDLPADDPKQRRPDLTLTKSLLQWSPKIPLKEGLIKTLEWVKTVET